jgi:hypothetical protein
MPMMPPMILMERICKEAEFVLNLPVTHVIAAGAVVVVAAAAVADSAEEVVVAAAAVEADSEEEMEAVPVATHLDPEPTTDWSWKICLLVHLGR